MWVASVDFSFQRSLRAPQVLKENLFSVFFGANDDEPSEISFGESAGPRRVLSGTGRGSPSDRPWGVRLLGGLYQRSLSDVSGLSGLISGLRGRAPRGLRSEVEAPVGFATE